MDLSFISIKWNFFKDSAPIELSKTEQKAP